MTYSLAITHLCLYGLALLLTQRPALTLFHLLLAVQAISFGIRPILSVIAGQPGIYAVNSDWEAYNLGLFYQLIFMTFYILGYLFLFARKITWEKPTVRIPTRGLWWSLSIGVLSVVLLHVFSDGMWLPLSRTQAITFIAPLGKFLFGLAVISLKATIALAFLIYIEQKRRISSLLAFLSALILLILLYQRGFVIMSLLVVAWLYARIVRQINYRKALLLGLVSLIFVFYLRPLINFILTGETKFLVTTPHGLWGHIINFARSLNFDSPDVWPITFAYVSQKGFLMGSTLVAIPARFLPPGIRYEIGLYTAVDELNAFYRRETYWSTGWGFNVSLPQELYMNFGPLLFFLGIVPGLLTAILDRWLYQVRNIKTSTVYYAAAAFFAGGFIGEPAGIIQWVIAYFILGIAVGFLARIKIAGVQKRRGETL